MTNLQTLKQEKAHRDYYKEENNKLRKEVEKLKNYIQGMKDLAFYLGGSGR